jgi:xanthine dehydrogenase YagT iron-sulfur-binding subunit
MTTRSTTFGEIPRGDTSSHHQSASEDRGGAEKSVPFETDTHIALGVNGVTRAVLVDNRATLLDTLRVDLGLSGTKKGCDHGQCGACTVLVDGRRSLACLMLAAMCDGRAVTTIEGLSVGEQLHPMQQAFIDQDALQCGYCTPGQICSAVGVLDEVGRGWPSAMTANRPVVKESDDISMGPELDEAEVRERMSGNLCRCGAYVNIVAAVLQAASAETAEASG